MTLTRYRVRAVLGALWILDGLLQLQRSMFTAAFAHQVLAPAGQGQPWLVSAPVALTARLVAAHPAAWDAGFAVIQLGLGIGFLVPRLTRPALAASVAWALGVWWLGEGLGGVAGGHADLLTGAPGAVLLYALLALAVWPRPGTDRSEHRPLPGVLAVAWAGLWIGGAGLRLLPGQASSAAVAAEIDANAAGSPGWLHHIDASVAAAVEPRGMLFVVGWVVVCVAVGLGALVEGPVRMVAVVIGIGLATVFWFVGQSLGQPWSGTATDPNTAPLIVLMALAVVGIGGPAPAYGRHRRSSSQGSVRPVLSLRWRAAPAAPATARAASAAGSRLAPDLLPGSWPAFSEHRPPAVAPEPGYASVPEAAAQLEPVPAGR